MFSSDHSSNGIICTFTIQLEWKSKYIDRFSQSLIIVEVSDHKNYNENFCQHGTDDQKVTESKVSSLDRWMLSLGVRVPPVLCYLINVPKHG